MTAYAGYYWMFVVTLLNTQACELYVIGCRNVAPSLCAANVSRRETVLTSLLSPYPEKTKIDQGVVQSS